MVVLEAVRSCLGTVVALVVDMRHMIAVVRSFRRGCCFDNLGCLGLGCSLGLTLWVVVLP